MLHGLLLCHFLEHVTQARCSISLTLMLLFASVPDGFSASFTDIIPSICAGTFSRLRGLDWAHLEVNVGLSGRERAVEGQVRESPSFRATVCVPSASDH